MKSRQEKTTVQGGWISRDRQTGLFREVGTSKGVSKASDVSRVALQEASAKRKAALRRLADR